ncbi:E3 ubiquitin-protein ligase MARCHF5-like [Lycorma delicatula]|uniref:E3 ubiquitin-protein ligase MARCHF5-like n=1 Tax=Lycorma delicatula TaxID=130591 RepID=UPI003F514343
MAEAAINTISTDYPTNQSRNTEERRYCWVCFASEDDDTSATWVQPCSCRGSTKWVHQACLQRWVDEKQKGNRTGKVSCPQCNTEYIIILPQMGPLLLILDTVDVAVYKVCPFVAAGIVVGSIYWTAVTYGAVTVMQVLGHKDGLTAMEHADPLVLLIGLPAIPIVLILGKMVRWEDTVLTFLRKYSPKLPLLKYILPSFACESEIPRNNSDLPAVSDTVSATRVLCSALLFPSVATVCGKVLFDNIPSNLQRTLLGGIAFIALKGCIKIYYKQLKYVRQNKRKILDFIPPEVGPNVPQPPQQIQ